MRKAFSLLTAIFIIVLMATVAAFIFSLSAKSVKATVVNYKKEQAVLYAKSYTELAIMAATANDNNATSCAERITGSAGPDIGVAVPADGKGYAIEVDISYIGDVVGSCGTTLTSSGTVQTPNSLHIIVDTFVRYKPSIDVDAGSSKWITYHRRTLQKL